MQFKCHLRHKVFCFTVFTMQSYICSIKQQSTLFNVCVIVCVCVGVCVSVCVPQTSTAGSEPSP